MIEKKKISQVESNPAEFDKKTIKVAGWIKTLRQSKQFAFMQLTDGSSFTGMQIVLESEFLDNYNAVVKLNAGAAVIIKGVLEHTPESKQAFELKARVVEIEGVSDGSYPLQKKRHSFEYLRTIAHLRPRTNTFNAVFRVRSLLAFAIHQFFQEKGFVYVHTPIITASDCEGVGEMFKVTTMDLADIPMVDGDIDYSRDFFNKETNLTVSGQLNVESYCMAFGDVYTFGPTFRAENSNTSRHAAEFWMIEPEIAFADLEDDMNLAQDMMKYIVRYVLKKAPQEMAFFNKFIDKSLFERLDNVLNSDFEELLKNCIMNGTRK